MLRIFKRIPLLCCLLAIGFSQGALAQADKPLRLVLGFPAGGPTDNVARPLAEQLSKELNRTVIVENRAGANGNIAAAYVARAAADGSVLFFSSVGAVAISAALYPTLSYDPLQDFAPVSLVVNNASILMVSTANPATDAADFVRRASRQSTPVPIASTGVGSIPHMALALFQDKTHANVVHVPYKGAAPAVVDILGGHVAGLFADAPAVMSQIQAGKLKALGVAGPSRLPIMPTVPTLAEQGMPDVESNNWYALLAPAATPKPMVEALSRATRAALSAPSLRDALMRLGTVPGGSTPDALAALIATDTAKWAQIIKAKQIVGE